MLGKRGALPFFSRLRKPSPGEAVRYVARVQPSRHEQKRERAWTQSLSDARVALIVIATVGVTLLLHYAKDLLIPIVAALVIAACLAPVDNRLRKIIPSNSIAAAATIVLALIAIGGARWLISDDIAVALEKLPDVSREFKEKLRLEPSTSNPVKKIAEAAQNLEDAANTVSVLAGQAATSPPLRPEKVEAPAPVRPSWLRSQLVLSSTTLLQGLLQLSFAFLVAFYISRARLALVHAHAADPQKSSVGPHYLPFLGRQTPFAPSSRNYPTIESEWYDWGRAKQSVPSLLSAYRWLVREATCPSLSECLSASPAQRSRCASKGSC